MPGNNIFDENPISEKGAAAGDDAAASRGEFLYWTATIFAGLVVAVVAATYLYDADRGMPVIAAAPLALAGAIWLIGWAGKHVLAGR